MGLAELSYETSRSQADYLIMIHSNGDIKDSYTLNDLDVGSEIKVDFREGIPPIITDLKAEAEEDTEVIEELVEIVDNHTEGDVEPIVESNGEMAESDIIGFDFSKGLSTGKAIFYSTESGFTVFSWIFLGTIGLVIVFFVFGKLKNRGMDDVDKYKKELESIKKQIRKKIREIKVLKAKGMKIKKMVELEEGFLEEKKGLGSVEKEIDLDEKGNSPKRD